MLAKRVVLVAVLALALAPLPALADSVEFDFSSGSLEAVTNPSDPSGPPEYLTTLSGDGASATLGAVSDPDSGTFLNASSLGSVDITSGDFVSGNELAAVFAPGGAINIYSNDNTEWGVASNNGIGELVFSGVFSTPETWTKTGSAAYTVTGGVSGTLSDDFATVFGLSSTSFTGDFSVDLGGALAGIHYPVESGSITGSTPVAAEPSTLVLLGLSLMVFAGLRRKLLHG